MNSVSSRIPAATRPTSVRRHARNVLPSGLTTGTVVTWEGAPYIAELVERHGVEWVAGLVPLALADSPCARMRFVPVAQLVRDELLPFPGARVARA